LPNLSIDTAAINKFAVANLFSMAYALMHGQVSVVATWYPVGPYMVTSLSK